jgi:hypothetical protein
MIGPRRILRVLTQPRLVLRRVSRIRHRLLPGSEILDPSCQTKDEFLAALHKMLSRDGATSRSLDDAWWDDFFAAITTNDELGAEPQGRMIQRLAELPDDAMTPSELLGVFKVAVKFGLLNLGYAIRSKAREVAIRALTENRLRTDSREYIGALAALLEAGKWRAFEQKLPLVDRSLDPEKRSLQILYGLLEDGRAGGDASGLIQSEDDLAYSKYVSGKRVALVGPARTDSRDADEIDGFDLVIRCNYKETGVGVDPEIKGLRCDVSYYNSAQAKFIYETNPHDTFPRTLDWLVCKHGARSAKLEKWIQTLPGSSDERARVRPSRTFEIPLFAGTLNAVPNAVLDLLGLGVGEIKIFHSDLMLTVDRAANYDPQVKNTEDALYLAVKSFAGAHDPITQYALLKTLYDSGTITGDAGFSTAMSLGEKSYMAALQVAYGESARSLG